jgi:hypothetical protein
MKLSDRMGQAADDWVLGAGFVVIVALVASIAMGATYIGLVVLGGVLDEPDWWPRMWAGGSAFLWYPFAAGRTLAYYRRRDLSAQSALTAKESRPTF